MKIDSCSATKFDFTRCPVSHSSLLIDRGYEPLNECAVVLDVDKVERIEYDANGSYNLNIADEDSFPVERSQVNSLPEQCNGEEEGGAEQMVESIG